MGLKKKLRNHSNELSSNKWVNKYTLTIALFAVWMMFFDKYNVFTQVKLSQTLSGLVAKKSNYEIELENALKEREIINSDIEKYAREKYLMHRDNEQVIIIN
ncbi:MAG: septum formation initiator family protein [Bacteroidia bacterium]|nr:septum formation initiator family protein [Bacteroidia bacterium]MBT8230145.1 septum formation initiator family protein [Bacteroidia bacterium]NNK89035.1 septum formation initiator family protein [Saprospiraceae bacterium]